MTDSATNGSPDSAALIQRLYQSVLHRQIRDDEVQHWMAALRAGVVDMVQVVDAVLSSTEAVDSARNRGSTETEADFTAAIGCIYTSMLGRAASADDIGLWWSALTGRLHSVSSMILQIAASDEARLRREATRPVDAGDKALRIAYQRAFDMPPQAADIANWVGKLSSDLECLAAGLASAAAAPRDGRIVVDAPPPAERAEAITVAVKQLYQLAFHRVAQPDEIAHWVGMVASGTLSASDLVTRLATSDEAVEKRSPLPEVSDGTFFQVAYELLLERGAMPNEIAEWQRAVAAGESDRAALEKSLFLSSARAAAANIEPPGNDASRTYLLGKAQYVTIEDWRAAGAALRSGTSSVPQTTFPPGYPVHPAPRVSVSAIASLYDGAAFIERFLGNITGQTIFESHCELIIVDANSPGGERAAIEPYLQRYRNIRYVRCPSRIGIYEAWNLGIAMASGRYVTNTNLDDLRRPDSFELQAGVLDNLGFVDVVYQDVLYSFDPDLDFDGIAAHGFTSNVPVVATQNMLAFNLPHNAPMWRRALHDDVGTFDTSYRSAGDYEFWLRCMKAGKTFFKVNDPHVAYFVNPNGISTRPDTKGVVEANRITRTHARSMVSRHLTCPPELFAAELGRLGGTSDHVDCATATDPHWRYTAAQTALRELSVRSRLAGGTAP